MFVETNVLVNARILEAPDHARARASLERAFAEPDAPRLSRHVLRAYLAVVTRPQTWAVPLSREDALTDVERLVTAFEVLEDGPVVTDRLVSLCRHVPNPRTSSAGRTKPANPKTGLSLYFGSSLLTYGPICPNSSR